MLFSERNGFTQPKQILQIDSMDEDLRNGIWNALYLFYFAKDDRNSYLYINELNCFFENLHVHYFKQRIDKYNESAFEFFEKNFFNAEWHKVYDIVELFSRHFKIEPINCMFRQACNLVLKREKSAYRFMGEQIVPISSEIEVQEIEQSLIITQNTKFKFVNNHLNQALRLFKNRENPDYRNSIKEAISAVESLCRLITEESDLEKSLNNLEKFIVINPQLKSGLKKIYAYTNGKEGIRHAQMLDSNVGFDEAKFMLIFCSGFINYLIAKWKDSETSSE